MSNVKNYGILSGATITAVSNTTIFGDVGALVTIVNAGNLNATGTITTGSGVSAALTNAQNMYNDLTVMTPTSTPPAGEIGGTVFTPGVYSYSGSITISSSIAFNGSGFYAIIVNGNVTTNPAGGTVNFNQQNFAQLSSVYWAVNGNVTIQTVGGNVTKFGGVILCTGGITMGAGCFSAGSLVAYTGSGNISVNSNSIWSQTDQADTDAIQNDHITLNSGVPDSSALKLYASNAVGGIDMQAGSGGISVSSNNGPISINSNGALISLGDKNGGEIQIGTNATSRVITSGNTATSTSLVNRWGSTGTLLSSQVTPTTANATATLTSAQLLTKLITSTPTAAITLTLPTAATLFSTLNNVSFTGTVGVQVNDSVEFSVVNLATTFPVTIAVGSGGTSVGGLIVPASTSGTFLLRFDTLASYVLYRISSQAGLPATPVTTIGANFLAVATNGVLANPVINFVQTNGTTAVNCPWAGTYPGGTLLAVNFVYAGTANGATFTYQLYSNATGVAGTQYAVSTVASTNTVVTAGSMTIVNQPAQGSLIFFLMQTSAGGTGARIYSFYLSI